MPQPPSDRELVEFLDQGYLVLQLDDISLSVHDQLFAQAREAYAARERLSGTRFGLEFIGDNLTTRMPQLNALLQSPRVDGALTSLLGPRYFRYKHSFIHQSGPNDQGFNKDSHFPWGLRAGLRSHRLNWAMAFYYPQDTTIDLLFRNSLWNATPPSSALGA